jgi:hypothetical protein
MNNKTGSVPATVLAIGLLGLLAAPITILSHHPDLTTRTGRHLLTGALGLTALVCIEIVICLIPLRRGEGWALWAAAIPLVVLGIPIFIVDAIFAPAQTRFATLLPQAIGDLFALAVLGYLFRQKYSRSSNVLDK